MSRREPLVSGSKGQDPSHHDRRYNQHHMEAAIICIERTTSVVLLSGDENEWFLMVLKFAQSKGGPGSPGAPFAFGSFLLL